MFLPFAAKGHLKIPTFTTATYDIGAFISMATKTSNNTQSQINPNKAGLFEGIKKLY